MTSFQMLLKFIQIDTLTLISFWNNKTAIILSFYTVKVISIPLISETNTSRPFFAPSANISVLSPFFSTASNIHLTSLMFHVSTLNHVLNWQFLRYYLKSSTAQIVFQVSNHILNSNYAFATLKSIIWRLIK